MADGTGDYFISDVDDVAEEDDDLLIAPVILPDAVPAPPVSPGHAPSAPATAAPTARPAPVAPPAPPFPPAQTYAPQQAPPAAPVQQPAPPAAAPAPVATAAVTPAPAPAAAPAGVSREAMLARELDGFMEGNSDVQASALVSLDGFTMASALPPGMQEDRVGAMSAAILGLGERAAAELGRGRLSDVFIEGEQGYVLLVSAGERAVLTVLASREAKLGLLLYDMKSVAARIGGILA